MSFFKGLFGRPAGPSSEPTVSSAGRAAAPSPDDSIKNMKSTKEMLEKKQSLIEQKIIMETQAAKKLAPLAAKNAQKKSEALRHLKRKKMYENQHEQLGGQIFNLDQTIFAMEKAITNKTLIDAQKAANNHLANQLKITGDADDVNEVMDDLIDNVSEVDDISQTLAQDVVIGNSDFDEDDLMNELDELDAENHDEYEAAILGPAPVSAGPVPVAPSTIDMPMPPSSLDMPTVPSHDAAADEEFAALEESMLI